MPKNIVVYSDGTGQDGGVRAEQHISNVYKMYRSSRVHPDNAIDPAEQICFYDPGLGTDSGARGLTGIMRKIDKLLQSVTGRGITKNMADCYEFIINHYKEGDRIYLIGFSRGAYTVRCLANTIMLCGIPTKAENGPLLRYRKQVHDIAMQHSEIAGTRDTIDAFRERLPRILRGLLANANYEIIKRSILPQAKIHPTVKERFALETIVDCASDKVGGYRPEALREHNDYKQFYPDSPAADAPPPGRSEEPAPPTQLLL